MGVVIRPPAFARGVAPRPLSGLRIRRRHRIDGRVVSIIGALAILTWILALAGAAFTVRVFCVLCFATLAGRVRRVGLQPRRF
jgi:hypothetical protein